MPPGRRASEPIPALVAKVHLPPLPGSPRFGSRGSAESLVDLASLADHVIVGTALETDGRPGAPLDPSEVKRFIAAADAAGLL